MASVLIDTNLMLLLIVGLTDPSLISKHKRTRAFHPDDYQLLVNQLSGFDTLWVTSHCLAEVSNLLRQVDLDRGQQLLASLSRLSASLHGRFRESHVPMSQVFGSPYLLRLGVADAGFIQKARRVNCSLTVDLDLYLAVAALGYTVVNFNHARQEHLLR